MSVTDTMRTILNADATFTGIITGGVLDKPITTDTEGVWGDPSPITGVRTLKPTGVLLEPQEVESPFALNPERRMDSEVWPELYFYAPASLMASVFDAADARAMALLHGAMSGLATLTATGFRARPMPAEELPGDNWQVFRRYRAALSRHIAEV